MVAPSPKRLPAAPSLGRLLVALALVTAAAGGLLLAGDGHGLRRTHVTAHGVPLTEVHPAGTGRRPGVVVAHGFSASAKLMAPFGDSLAAAGYVVVLLDFAGHGANTTPLPDDAAATGASVSELQRDLDVAVAHLRALPDVDPSRIGLVGHSMGATEVTRYAAAHPSVRATVALSLPGSSVAPGHLLLLYGGLEFPGFRSAAEAVAREGPDRRASEVPGVEHISILYAPRAHRETVAWLDRQLGRGVRARALPSPLRRVGGAALLTTAFLFGLYPLAGVLMSGPLWMMSGNCGGRVGRSAPPVPGGAGQQASRAAEPRFQRSRPGREDEGAPFRRDRLALETEETDETGRGRHQFGGATGGTALRPPATTWARAAAATGVSAGAAAVAVLAAPHLPTERLPIAIGGFIVGYTLVIGVVLTAYGIWRRPAREAPGGRRLVALIPYAVAAIALPTNLGLTHAVPVGPRWWLVPVLWAGFAVLAYGTERATGGDTRGVAAIAAVVVVALAGAAVPGLTHGFVLLAVPPLVLLFLWQTLWSAALNRLGARPGLIAAVGSVVVAWPLGIALPLVG